MPISFESGERLSFIVTLELPTIFIPGGYSKQLTVGSVVPAGKDSNVPFIRVFSFSNY